MAYRIRNWDRHYETNKTRPLKTLTWIALPVALDSDGYAELMEHPNGASHFGIFVAMLEVAAHCVPRGCLLRAREVPHDARSLSRVCRVPAPMVQEAIEQLLSIGWIEAWEKRQPSALVVPEKRPETGDTGPVLPGLPGQPVGEGGPVGHNQPGRPDQPGGNGEGAAASATAPAARGKEATEALRVKAKERLGTASMERNES